MFLEFLFVYQKRPSAELSVKEFEVHLVDVDMLSMLRSVTGAAFPKTQNKTSNTLQAHFVQYIITLLQLERQVQGLTI